MNSSTQHTIVLNIDKDIYYSLNDGVMKPMKRHTALALIVNTTAMIVSGNLVRIAVTGVVQS